MLILPLLAAMLSASLIGLAVLCVVATRQPELAPASGTFFPPAVGTDPSADTLAGHHAEGTMAGDWQSVECGNLAVAEDVLDLLESRDVRFREFEIVGKDRFVVRYR